MSFRSGFFLTVALNCGAASARPPMLATEDLPPFSHRCDGGKSIGGISTDIVVEMTRRGGASFALGFIHGRGPAR
ncbi:MAG TPA: hypothetical protein VEC06_14405 [Paucimonas sp.]|nr:hypothetical protein [Paucimonas sp.]